MSPDEFELAEQGLKLLEYFWLPLISGFAGTSLLLVFGIRNNENVNECRATLLLRLILLIGTMLFGFFSITSFVPGFYGQGSSSDIWFGCTFIALFLVCAFFFLDSLFKRIVWDSANLSVKGFLKREKLYAWCEITKVRHRPLLQSWEIIFLDDRKLSISEAMLGHRAFLNAYDEHGNKSDRSPHISANAN